MATPKPGEIRCPTCHRSTPPAAFCTQCGSTIPSDARARPRGMDREELQDRIRARRSGGDPYRRGAASDDDNAGYERFEPRPEDARARYGPKEPSGRRIDYFEEREVAGAATGASLLPPPDITREPEPDSWDTWQGTGDETPTVTGMPEPGSAPGYAPPALDLDGNGDAGRGYEPGRAAIDGDLYDHDGHGDPDAYGYDVEYERWEEPHERRAGGGLAIVAFLALGVVALLGGAVLAGVFDADRGVADATATPTPTPEATPEPEPTVAPSGSPDATGPAGSPGPTNGPVTFPDGFVARAQPCLPGTAQQTGCSSNGAQNSGSVDVWIGFENGTGDDVIGAALIGPDGSTLQEGSIPLERINCGRTCNGWTRFGFSGLGAGDYEVRITRNGDPASVTRFEVT